MTQAMKINFASDNAAPVTPEILAALGDANMGAALGYGNDPLTGEVEEKLKSIFECDLMAFPVATGTAANVLGLSIMLPPYGAVYCHQLAHIEQDECGAPEFYSGGGKLALLAGDDGKLSADTLSRALSQAGAGVVHHAQPSAISVTQASECGTLYSPNEIGAISEIAKRHGLGLHMDGARFANAAAALACTPADMTWRAGVDVLSFGATKNGAMAAEAVVFFDMEKSKEFEFRRKRGGHLFSKMRYLSAQLNAYLTNDRWLKTATHANEMASGLAGEILNIAGAELVYPVEANIVFARLPAHVLDRLAASDVLYYPSGPAENREIRLVASWNTTADDIEKLMAVLR